MTAEKERIMNILEQVAKWIGVELNKQFQVYDQEGASTR